MKIIVGILIFGLIVLIHEGGHFILAKINGIKVNEFMIGFGPKLCGFHKGGTLFSIRLLPIGGACLMLGEDEDQTLEQEGSFYSKGAWNRVAVLFAGPFFNFILAFVLAVIITLNIGADIPIVTGIDSNGPAAQAGLQNDDIIKKIDNKKIVIGREYGDYLDFNQLSEQKVQLTVQRGKEKKEITVTPVYVERYVLGFTYTLNEEEAKVYNLVKDYPMMRAGMKDNDVIISINGTSVKSSQELSDYMTEHPLSGETVTLTYLRDGEENSVEIKPMLAGYYSMGFDAEAYKKQNFFRVIGYSAYEVKYWIQMTFSSLVQLFTGKLHKEDVGSTIAVFDAIGQTYEETKKEGLRVLLVSLGYLTIMLSANIGVMNLLPIPALDGGKLLFCFIEIVRGKPIDREKEGIINLIGFFLVIILIVFLTFNDIQNIILKK